MYEYTINLRVRYYETDQMGYCYYGNYAQYYEVARVETLRSIGIVYKELEEEGVLLPVYDFNIKYLLPSTYDQKLKIKCIIKEISKFQIKFYYETQDMNGDLLNFGSTTLVFVDKKTKKPVNCPIEIKKKLIKIAK